MLDELGSAGRTTPWTVIDCLSELTPISLVPSMTRLPLDWTSITRAEIVVDKERLREVEPWPGEVPVSLDRAEQIGQPRADDSGDAGDGGCDRRFAGGIRSAADYGGRGFIHDDGDDVVHLAGADIAGRIGKASGSGIERSGRGSQLRKEGNRNQKND